MTNREFYNAIVSAKISEEITEFAEKAIAKMDEKNAKRSNTKSATQVANDEIKVAILAQMEAEKVYTCKEISEKHEISTQKTSALMRQLAQSGKVEVSEVKVKGSGIVKGYTIVTEN